MTKDVIITVQGLQFTSEDDSNPEPIEIVNFGEYYKKNGHHYILFDEASEGDTGTVHNMMKFTEKTLEVKKSGDINVQMFFEMGKKTFSIYRTSYGMFNMGNRTTGFELKEGPNNMVLCVEYAMDVNDKYIADCSIALNIRSRENGGFKL